VELRLLTPDDDISGIRLAYNSYVAQHFKVAQQFVRTEDFAQTLMPRPDVVVTLSVIGGNGDPTRDFISFYMNASSIEGGPNAPSSFRVLLQIHDSLTKRFDSKWSLLDI